ncbi:MAG TPA: response regulator [Xanthobacteraceae bacterium]|nr:response regulator [Xanthobacteraceae bacterium]
MYDPAAAFEPRTSQNHPPNMRGESRARGAAVERDCASAGSDNGSRDCGRAGLSYTVRAARTSARAARVINKVPTINRYSSDRVGNKTAAPRLHKRTVDEEGTVNPAVLGDHCDRGKGNGGNRRGRRVLVVEDEALICVETADTLERQGFEVHIALSGEEALRRLRSGLAVDVLFTDINLAGTMDGATLARLARELDPAVGVVYTSGTVDTVPQPVARSAFVPKPYNPDRVGRMLSELAGAKPH